MRHFGLSLLSFSALLANPSAPVIMEGAGSFAESGQLFEITAADKTVIHWEQFSIANGETTRFVQPSQQAVVLNRVIGPLQSFIDGRLEANGRVVLVNPNGVVIGPNGVILAADFLASTYDIFNIADGSIQERRESNFSSAINMDGIIRATGFAEEGGKIVLVAETVNIGKEAFLCVDGQGNGGEVKILADGTANFEGTISAQGGPLGGDGGFVEVSGNRLNFTGFVDRRAAFGEAGTLLLDPINITITAAADSANVTPGATYTFTACAPSPANIDAAALGVNLGVGPVVINTSAAGGAGCPDAGDITVSSPFTWAAANSLTLIADNDITILADINCTAAGPISITAAGALVIGSAANVVTANVQTQGQIDVLAGTGMLVIGGAGGGDSSIQTTLTTAPLNITVTSGNFTVSSVTSADQALVGDAITGGLATITVSNGGLLVENNNGGNAIVGTADAFNISVSQDIEVTSLGAGISGIECGNATANPSTVNVGADLLLDSAVGGGICEIHLAGSFPVFNIGQDMTLTNSSGSNSGCSFELGAILNIGRNFYVSSSNGGDAFIAAGLDMTMNVLGNFTVQNQGTEQSDVTSFGVLNLNVTRDINIENLGATTFLNAFVGGVLGTNVDAGGGVILGQDGRIVTQLGAILVIADRDIVMGQNSAIDGFGPGITGITLVVDNQAPAAPAIGTGAFLMDPTAFINTGPVIPVQIFTARQSQNSIQGLINGAPFVPGPFSVDTPTEHWGVYYPDAFVGPLYTVFYKEGFASTPAILTAILNASTQSIAGVFDLFEEFAAPLPYYDDHFCFTYQEEKQRKRRECPWILVDNYRKYYPSLSRWEYVQPMMEAK